MGMSLTSSCFQKLEPSTVNSLGSSPRVIFNSALLLRSHLLKNQNYPLASKNPETKHLYSAAAVGTRPADRDRLTPKLGCHRLESRELHIPNRGGQVDQVPNSGSLQATSRARRLQTSSQPVRSVSGHGLGEHRHHTGGHSCWPTADCGAQSQYG